MSSAPVQVSLERPAQPAPIAYPRPKRSIRAVTITAVVCIVAVTIGIARHFSQPERTGPTLRTAVVTSGDFVRSIRFRGTVEATRSYIIAAPTLNGQQFGTLTVT